MDTKRPAKPKAFHPVSPVVVVLVAAMVIVELVFQAGEHGLIGGPLAEGWRVEVARHFGFHKAVFDHILMGGDLEPKVIWPFLSYLFVHQGFLHMLIASALILAMGKMIAEMFSGLAVIVLFILCGLTSAVVFGFFSKEGGFPLVGAYPVFYGFIGTFTWIRIFELRSLGKNILPAFQAVGMFAIFRGTFAVFTGVPNGWTADLTGLLTGFLLAYILAPDGKDRIRRWVQKFRER